MRQWQWQWKQKKDETSTMEIAEMGIFITDLDAEYAAFCSGWKEKLGDGK